MTTQTFLYNIRELIAKGNLKLALNQLRQLLKNSPKLDDALLQSARFSDLLNGIKLGVLDLEHHKRAGQGLGHGASGLWRSGLDVQF